MKPIGFVFPSPPDNFPRFLQSAVGIFFAIFMGFIGKPYFHKTKFIGKLYFYSPKFIGTVYFCRVKFIENCNLYA